MDTEMKRLEGNEGEGKKKGERCESSRAESRVWLPHRLEEEAKKREVMN